MLEKAYELIFAFDEVITAGGYREPINIAQIRTNMEMESHEEKLHNMIKTSKMESARDQAKEAARSIMDRKRMEGIGGGGGGGDGRGGYSSNDSMNDPAVQAAQAEAQRAREAALQPPVAAKAAVKGMDILAKKETKNNSLLDALVKEEKLAPIMAKKAATSGAAGNDSGAGNEGAVVHPITLQAVEKITAQLTRDGDVTNVEVKGNLTLTAADDAVACCAVQLAVDPTAARSFTFNTHPKVNKALYEANNVLIMKDTNKGFPSGRPVGILRWSNSQSSGDYIPITVNCWPEEESKNRMLVTIDYSAVSRFQLHDVKIHIPVMSAEAPVINTIDGRYKHNRNASMLTWELDLIDDSNSSGNLEFTIAEKDADSFFPIKIEFSSQQMYCNMDVTTVRNIPPGADISGATSSIMYGYTKCMMTDEYIIE